MNFREHRELFQAVLAIAGADGRIARPEKGLLEALADRIGVGKVSLQAMLERAAQEPTYVQQLRLGEVSNPAKAMELLVAAARIDGEISESERQLLLRIAAALKLPSGDFAAAFERGMATADRVRAQRKHPDDARAT